jgi:hypothetical protein
VDGTGVDGTGVDGTGVDGIGAPSHAPRPAALPRPRAIRIGGIIS